MINRRFSVGEAKIVLALAVALIALVPVMGRDLMGRDQEESGRRERAYLAESDVAMHQMMQLMQQIPSGDVDRDFVDQMVPHHEGAIAMAQALLRTGKNERLKRIAQEIIVTQREEIAAMHLATSQSAGSNVE